MKLWGFDLESYLILPGLAAPKPVCGSWADERGEWLGTPSETVEFFRSALERGDHLAGVNIAYDVVLMGAYWPELLPLIFQAGNAGQFHCCAVAEALHDIAIDRLFTDYKTGKSVAKRDENGEMSGRYSMAILMDRHFGQDISAEKTGDVWRYKYASLDGVPPAQWPEAARAYPLSDARRPFDIWQRQAKHRNLHDEPKQTRAAISLMLARTWGFRTDGAYLAHLEGQVDALWDSARAEFAKAGIFRPDGSKDTKLLQEMVSQAYGGNPPRTPKGAVSIDRDTLEESGVEILVKLGTSGKNDKRKTTYLPALKEGIDRPITPEFNTLVATGRISSDWQQLPQKGGLREGIIARPEYVIGSLDYGGLELRTMSQRAILEPGVGFSKMADFINEGKDPHCHFGSWIVGVSYEEFDARKKKDLKPIRDVAKIFNFGAGGGAGGFALAYNAKVKDNVRLCLSLGRAERCGEHKTAGFIGGKQKHVCSVCVKIAKDLIDLWRYKAWPEQGLLADKASRLTQKGRKVEVTVFGSKRLRGGCGYTQWLNTPFQGAGGDGCKAAMWRIQKEAYTQRRSPLWGSRVFLNVHDELLIEFPEDRRHEAAFRAAKLMVATMNEITPDVSNEVTPAIMRRVFKAASDVYSRSKELRPWWPPDAGNPWAWGPDQEVMARDLAS